MAAIRSTCQTPLALTLLALAACAHAPVQPDGAPLEQVVRAAEPAPVAPAAAVPAPAGETPVLTPAVQTTVGAPAQTTAEPPTPPAVTAGGQGGAAPPPPPPPGAPPPPRAPPRAA